MEGAQEVALARAGEALEEDVEEVAGANFPEGAFPLDEDLEVGGPDPAMSE